MAKHWSEAMRPTPTKEQLDAAPILEGWLIEDTGTGRPWIYAWFYGHPEVAHGDHGHTSPVLQVDPESPPRWAWTDSRLYRLGNSYPPAEREIRYWSQKIRFHQALPLGDVPGGSDDIEAMLNIIRNSTRLREEKVAKMEQAFRRERQLWPDLS